MSEKLVIGITEGNDPAFCPSWFDRAINCDGTVIISKGLTEQVRNSILQLYELTKGHVLVHCTCTGFGGTLLEPFVPTPEEQTENLYRLVASGFPGENVVFRIDPVIPTDNGMDRFQRAFSCLQSLNERLTAEDLSPVTRVRLSLMDNYRHVNERFAEAGLPPLYEGRFYAPAELQAKASLRLREILQTALYPVSLELCAEDGFADRLGDLVPHSTNGCLSEKDLRLMGFSDSQIEATMKAGENAQCRPGCHCISCKRELIPAHGRCGHQCLYCFWRDAESKELDGQISF